MLRIPYRQRILYYCETNGVVVPKDFDAPKSSDKFAAIDMTSQPPVLVKRTTYMEKEVIQFLQEPENSGRSFKILDFKRGLELVYEGGNKLSKVGTFDCKAPGELLSLVAP
jgi:hypothetical protein